jgi:aminoglycoside phosphotransferase (APT) family kinase protein
MLTATLERTELVGKGFCSDIYGWGRGRVLKLFHDWVTHERAEHEFEVTQAIHAAGLPVHDAYELLEIEGRWGIVFEWVDGVSLLDYIQARPWRLLDAMQQLAELHAEVHRCTAPDWLPSLRERVAAGIDASDSSEAEKQAARDRLASLPDGNALCHGDFHPGNVMLTSRGPVVIDWDSASRGAPIGDVACTVQLMRIAYLPPWTPGYIRWSFECVRPVIHRSYVNRYLRLHAATRRQMEAWQTPLTVARRSWRPLSAPA